MKIGLIFSFFMFLSSQAAFLPFGELCVFSSLGAWEKWDRGLSLRVISGFRGREPADNRSRTISGKTCFECQLVTGSWYWSWWNDHTWEATFHALEEKSSHLLRCLRPRFHFHEHLLSCLYFSSIFLVSVSILSLVCILLYTLDVLCSDAIMPSTHTFLVWYKI